MFSIVEDPAAFSLKEHNKMLKTLISPQNFKRFLLHTFYAYKAPFRIVGYYNFEKSKISKKIPLINKFVGILLLILLNVVDLGRNLILELV